MIRTSVVWARKAHPYRGTYAESSYAIDSQEQLVRIKVWGELTVEGLIELMKHAGADPRYVPGMPAIADYRDAHGDWDYSDIQRFRDYIVRIAVRKQARWAAVVKPGALAAMGHILILISEAVGCRIRMRLFDEPAAALRWVKESDGSDVSGRLCLGPGG
ncbi:MAG TPA: hypothetical protein VK025_00360 [Steroidobacter sp.]|jgi:hypothetical protein|nr:hypothetical protein [Steroidobacteraceae bacterium]HLS79842.1 hypothetical protein [Steroidobacter sp.]